MLLAGSDASATAPLAETLALLADQLTAEEAAEVAAAFGLSPQQP